MFTVLALASPCFLLPLAVELSRRLFFTLAFCSTSADFYTCCLLSTKWSRVFSPGFVSCSFLFIFSCSFIRFILLITFCSSLPISHWLIRSQWMVSSTENLGSFQFRLSYRRSASFVLVQFIFHFVYFSPLLWEHLFLSTVALVWSVL